MLVSCVKVGLHTLCLSDFCILSLHISGLRVIMVRSRSPHGSTTGQQSDAGASADEQAVTCSSMEAMFQRFLSPLAASIEALRESNALILTSQSALNTRVDAIDVSLKRHSERLDVV